MAEMTVVLTGATSGVGWGVAQTLGGQGARVVALARNTDRAEEVLRDVAGVEIVECDLASLASVDSAASEVLDRCPRIDVLMGCAGVAPWRRRQSADGFELAFATNVLGHVRLTERLRDSMVASAPSRIVMISGDAHRSGAIRWDDLQLTKNYSAMAAGKQAALAKIMWTFHTAASLADTGVTVNTFCPAFVKSGITRDFPVWMRPLIALGNLFAQSPERGARTPVWMASAPELEGVTGKFFRHEAERESSPASRDTKAQERLVATIRDLIASQLSE